MRALAALPMLLLLAACLGGGPAPLPTQSVSAAFPPHGIADTIVVNAVDRLPLSAVELIAPNGTATPASSIDVTQSPAVESGQWGVNDPYRGNLPSANLASPVPQQPMADAALRSETRLMITVATADIALADPVAYRRDWQQYRIRLHFGTPPGALELREIPAPEPPP